MTTASPPATTPLPHHDTFQSDETFDVDLYVRDLAPANVSVTFRERSLTIVVPGVTYHVEPLAHEIDPAGSSYTVSKFKLELVLKKKLVGIQWNHLQGVEANLTMSAPHSKEETTPAVERQTKDWSKICDEALKGEQDSIHDLVRTL